MIERRRFVAIATGQFEADGTYPPLDVASEVRDIEGWLCAPELDARRFTREFPRLAANPSRAAILGDVARLGGDEAVVVYVTGHGAPDVRGHQIVLAVSDPANLNSTALATADLVIELARCRELDDVLLIIDLCQAGDFAAELATQLRPIIPRRWIVLLATAPGAGAKVGALSGTVRDVIAEIRDSEAPEITELEPYLQSHEFIARIKRALWEAHRQDLIPAMDPYSESRCLPNPHFQADRVPTSPARRDLAVLQEDMAAHWRRRAPVEGTPFLFAGRSRVMERLVAFCAGPVGALVVTGGAGSGKSAVLARLVTCSDPAFRSAYGSVLERVPPVPPPDAVDVAVLATGKSPLQIAAQIGAAVGAEAETVEGWTEAIVGALSDPITIVVDAVDEASDPLALIRSVLQPLLAHVRLLVGVRSTGHERDYASLSIEALDAPSLAVDDDEFWDAEDLRRLLRESVSPELAARIEAGADRSFLLALLVASRADEDGADIDALLAGGVAEVVRTELAGRDDLIAFLRATALAFGRGLPWRDIWPAVAAAIAPPGVTVDVAALLQDRAAGYLVRDLEDGITVYRPFHDALRESLARDAEPNHPPFEEAQARVAEVLLSHLPAPYVRRHLPENAAAAGQLDERYVNRTTLPYLDAASLSRTLRSVEAASESTFGALLVAWRSIRHRWDFENPERNAAALDLALTFLRARPEPSTRWDPLWAEWPTGGSVIGRAAPQAPEIAFGMVDGRMCLAIADGAKAQIWDAATNEPLGPAMPVGQAYHVALSPGARGDFLIVHGTDGLTAWDAAIGRSVWHREAEPSAHVAAGHGFVASANGRSVAVRDAATGRLVLRPFSSQGLVTAIALAQDTTGATWLLAATTGGRIAQLELETGRFRESRELTMDSGRIVHLSAHPYGKDLAIAATSSTGLAWVFDAFGEERYEFAHGTADHAVFADYEPGLSLVTTAGNTVTIPRGWWGVASERRLPHPATVTAVAFGVVDGRPVLAAACADGAVRLWDAVAPFGERAQTPPITGIKIGADRRGPSVAAWFEAGAAAWALENGDLRFGFEGTDAPVTTASIGKGDEEMLAVYASATEVGVWDAGTMPRSPQSQADVAVVGGKALLAELHGARLLEVWDVIAGERLYRINGPVRRAFFLGAWLAVERPQGLYLHDALSGERVHRIPDAHGEQVALGRLEGADVVVTGNDAQVALWNLRTGEPCGIPIEVGGTLTGVGLARVGLQDLIITGHTRTVRAWNAATGRAVTELPFGTTISATAVWSDGERALIAVSGPGIAVVELLPA